MFSQEQVDRVSMIVVYEYESCLKDGLDDDDDFGHADDFEEYYRRRILSSLTFDDVLCAVFHHVYFNVAFVHRLFVLEFIDIKNRNRDFDDSELTEMQLAILSFVSYAPFLLWYLHGTIFPPIFRVRQP